MQIEMPAEAGFAMSSKHQYRALNEFLVNVNDCSEELFALMMSCGRKSIGIMTTGETSASETSTDSENEWNESSASQRKPSSAEKIRHRVPTPHTSRISKSTTQLSGLNVSRITDLSTNPTDGLSHPSAISLTTQHSSRSKRSSAMRKKNKKRRSQKPLANIDSSNPKEPWLDLSFLNRQCTQEDYLCNYWRYTVADEQSMRFDYFLNVIDAHESELAGKATMNTAIELGPDAPTMLKRPDLRAEQAIANVSVKKPTATKVAPARIQEITFRSIVEEFAASHNLLFIPTGRAHEKSRMPLFRVSSSIGGKGGLLVYVQDDAVWAPDGDEYGAITLEDMVLRANK
ncbi:hypothetical protein EV702DRAFT_1284894 [Suillus placidus]|uniref:Uncharacterized protein n=1 Tax=Suillus placidus TaxID=48579 RepID=A0A9P6ZES0_9AGAM|nr:hypothetical protein EV702DRAFT_1284894 [Suillus placidus]